MTDLGRILVLAGLFMVVAGLLLWGLGRVGFRRLPGDIRYQTENVRIYFPIVSMIVLSVVLTALLWVVSWLSGR